ncbi:putative monooxygenase [Microthyrium microscopicum]|uniref:Putative monooxygenase n=1 Tax=Microthyrium microscopicum TaxID=703497 RepID=A0A6A6UQN6_9PEZI|nr:putative monooxygenase [Microthyrium microscopicum]
MDAEILIIGAGATGLALAQGLRRAGISCIVFERDDGLFARSRDWNFAVHWSADALRAIIGDEAWSKIQTVQVDPNTPTKHMDGLKFLNAATGELVNEAKIDYFYRLKRSAFRELLADGVDLRFGKRLESVNFSEDGEWATAKFADGSNVTGRMIVGADGPKSVVRDLLLGASRPTRIPYVATFVQAQFTREQALFLRSFHPLYLAGVHPDNMFAFFGMQDASDAEKPETWTFFFYISYHSSLEEQDQAADWTSRQYLDVLKERAKTFCDPWKSALEWVSEDLPVWHSTFSDWDPSVPEHKWDNRNGRMTLAGDAAHVMTVQRGQGLNHAITDVSQLLEAITKSRGDGTTNQATAISDYEARMTERSGEEVRQCTINTKMLHDWASFQNSPVMKKGLKKD